MEEFTNRVMYSNEWPKEVGASKWGGAVDASLFTWRTKESIIMINADQIKGGMNLEKAREQVYTTAWPLDEVEKKEVMFMVLSKKHMYVAVMKKPTIKGMFAIGEEAEVVLTKVLESILKENTREHSERLLEMTGQERSEAILAALHRAKGSLPLFTKPKKKSQPKRTQGVRWADEQDESTWQTMQPRRRRISMRVTSDEPEEKAVGCLVVYTDTPSEAVVAEIRRQDAGVGELIRSARQKDGHVILEAKRMNGEQLRGNMEQIRAMGMQVSQYHFRETSLGDRSRRGLEEQIRAEGICMNYYNRRPCRFGQRCRFKCYDFRDRR
jgi:hypothetical protein